MATHQHSEPGNVDFDGVPSVVERRHPLSMVYGGGGVFGIAYGLGVAHGLADRGVPVAEAPALGTSAGSWVASAVALGISHEAFQELDSPSVPTRRPVLIERARMVFGHARHHLVSVSAVYLRSGRRHVLDGGVYDLADLVAASSAVPGIFPPHRVEGRLYVDGGMWSATSVDAAADAEHVIVVAPLAGPVLGVVGRTAGFLLRRELDNWQERHSAATITMIRPTRKIARLAGRNPLNLFDGDRTADVYLLAREQGQEWGGRMRGRHAA